jgi:16S rRNA (adenine1518-N6/adenine1519-N6)-dimethyltransferase
VLELVAKAWASGQFQRVKLVANLPYAVATPVISNFLLTDIPFERMVVTVQWEIAERLMAQPSTKDFSGLSVLVQALADVELVRRLPPASFWPRPQVDSAIICIWPRAEKRVRLANPQAFRNFLRDLYSHRRKNLRGALLAFPGDTRDKEQIDTLLQTIQLDGTARAETLTIDQHLQLFGKFVG